MGAGEGKVGEEKGEWGRGDGSGEEVEKNQIGKVSRNGGGEQ